MNIEELAISEGIWSTESKDVSDIVLKSSIKFYRNLDNRVFAHKHSKKEKEKIIRSITEKIKNNIYCTNVSIYNLESISEVDKNILIERNILSTDKTFDGSLVLSNDQDYYFLLCNRDHIEFIVLNSGFLVDDIYVFGKKVILQLENELPFSFNQSFGYLSSNPENSGSGITFILTLHLPGLIFSSKINEIISLFEKRGIGVKSGWIEGYYEISNKYSAGFSEKEIYENTVTGFKEVIDQERESREQEYSVNKCLIEDKVWRSYGILLSSRLISLYETFDLLSHLRFGISLGIINYLTIKDINLLLYYIQDFHLKKRYNIEDENINIDEFRAQFLRDYLKEVI